MFEERDTNTSLPSFEGDGANTATRADQERRALLIQRIILVGTMQSIITLLVYLFVYIQHRQLGVWQILIDAAGLVIGIACLGFAYRLARRGRLDAAGYWVIVTLLVNYGASELAWSDETWYNVIGGTLLIILIGNLVLPQKWQTWLIAVVALIAAFGLINYFEPLPRYPAITMSKIVYFFDLGLTILLITAALAFIIQALRIGTIRTRLLISFVLMTLLSIIAITGSAVLLSWQSGRQQAIERLEAVATQTETEIKAWADTLHSTLSIMLIEEETRAGMVQLLQTVPPTPAPDQDAYHKIHRLFESTAQEVPILEELFIVNLEGRVILSTNSRQEGLIYLDRTFPQRSQEGPAIQPPIYDPTLGRTTIIASRPILDAQGRAVGILAGRTGLPALDDIVARASDPGKTDALYLVGADRRLLASLQPGLRNVIVRTRGVNAALGTRGSGSEMYDDDSGESVIGVYRWLPELEVALVAEQRQATVLGTIRPLILSNVGIALVASLIAVGASLLITRSIAGPLGKLAHTASQVAAGDFTRSVEVEREDEIGALAEAFNQMNARLYELISSLEQRVSDRTQELEERSAYLRASAEVGRAASSILDPDQLIQQVVELIRDWFDLYYVGLFLVDETGEWAVLRAGTGEAGRAMLTRGHRLRVGQGMIGWSVAQAQARIALQAEADAVRTTNPELPNTRSEAALPLRSRGQVIGALTVQSDQPDAFNEESIAVLQNLADQVAVALENARLYTESQAALEAVRRAYSELSREAWIELLRTRPDLGFHSSTTGITAVTDGLRPNMKRAIEEGRTVQGNGSGAKETLALSVPIKVRDVVIGVLDTYKPAGAGPWTPEEIGLLETLTEQLGIALEGARLYQDVQRRAAREGVTREITDKMRRATSVQDIVQTAVDELFDILGTSRAFVRLEANTLPQDNQESITTVEVTDTAQ